MAEKKETKAKEAPSTIDNGKLKKIIHLSLKGPLNCPPISSGERSLSFTKKHVHTMEGWINVETGMLSIKRKGFSGEVLVHISNVDGCTVE